MAGDPCQHFGMDVQRPDEHEGAYELLQRGRALSAARHHAQAAIVLERAAQKEPGHGAAEILERIDHT